MPRPKLKKELRKIGTSITISPKVIKDFKKKVKNVSGFVEYSMKEYLEKHGK